MILSAAVVDLSAGADSRWDVFVDQVITSISASRHLHYIHIGLVGCVSRARQVNIPLSESKLLCYEILISRFIVVCQV